MSDWWSESTRIHVEAGMKDPALIVWDQGVDVSDQPWQTWPWPYRAYAERGWRPGMKWRPEFAPTM